MHNLKDDEPDKVWEISYCIQSLGKHIKRKSDLKQATCALLNLAPRI